MKCMNNLQYTQHAVIWDPPANACQCFDHPTSDHRREMPQSFTEQVQVSFIQQWGRFSFTTKELKRKCHASNGYRNKLNNDSLTVSDF